MSSPVVVEAEEVEAAGVVSPARLGLRVSPCWHRGD